MEHSIEIKKLFRANGEYDNKEIFVAGWVKSLRASNVFGFIELNDGTFFKNLQVVFEKENISNYDEVAKLNIGSSVFVRGLLVPTPEAKQPFELKATEVIIEGKSTPDYPLQNKRHSFEYLRSIAHLRPRAKSEAKRS